jgi:hypothetical protein
MSFGDFRISIGMSRSGQLIKLAKSLTFDPQNYVITLKFGSKPQKYI